MNSDPVSQKIKVYLNSLIEQNRFNLSFKLPSENQLAHLFKSSRTPVQHALAELKEEGVIYRVHGKGTFVCNQPQSEDSFSVCLSIPHLNTRYIKKIAKGIQDYFNEKGVVLLISITNDDPETEENVINYVLSNGFQGLILYPIISDTYHDGLFKLALKKYPVVVVARQLPKINFSSVHSDNYGQLQNLTDYLVGKGHKYIGFIKESNMYENSVYEDRERAYREYISQRFGEQSIHILEVNPIQENDDVFPNKWLDPLVAEFLVQNPDMTAIITMSVAAGAVFRLLKKRSELENTISVAIIDDPEDAESALEYKNDVVVLDQNPYQIGWESANQLYNQICHNALTQDIIIENTIRVINAM